MVCDGSGQELLFDGYSGLLGGADGEELLLSLTGCRMT